MNRSIQLQLSRISFSTMMTTNSTDHQPNQLPIKKRLHTSDTIMVKEPASSASQPPIHINIKGTGVKVKGSKGSRSAARPPTKPKRPLSAYNLFYRFKREKVIALGNGEEVDKEAIIRVVQAPPGLEDCPPTAAMMASSPGHAAHIAHIRRTTIRKALESNLLPRDTRSRSHRTNSNAINGAMTFLELGKLMNISWQKCDEFAKEVFCELAEEGREVYRKKMEQFHLTGGLLPRGDLEIGQAHKNSGVSREGMAAATKVVWPAEKEEAPKIVHEASLAFASKEESPIKKDNIETSIMESNLYAPVSLTRRVSGEVFPNNYGRMPFGFAGAKRGHQHDANTFDGSPPGFKQYEFGSIGSTRPQGLMQPHHFHLEETEAKNVSTAKALLDLASRDGMPSQNKFDGMAEMKMHGGIHNDFFKPGPENNRHSFGQHSYGHHTNDNSKDPSSLLQERVKHLEEEIVKERARVSQLKDHLFARHSAFQDHLLHAQLTQAMCMEHQNSMGNRGAAMVTPQPNYYYPPPNHHPWFGQDKDDGLHSLASVAGMIQPPTPSFQEGKMLLGSYHSANYNIMGGVMDAFPNKKQRRV